MIGYLGEWTTDFQAVDFQILVDSSSSRKEKKRTIFGEEKNLHRRNQNVRIYRHR